MRHSGTCDFVLSSSYDALSGIVIIRLGPHTRLCLSSLHLVELQRQPETHWHPCDYERFCAVVPVVHNGRCLACVKFASSTSLPEDEFGRRLELLDILVRDFVSCGAGERGAVTQGNSAG